MVDDDETPDMVWPIVLLNVILVSYCLYQCRAFQRFFGNELQFIHESKVNLQSVAANIQYEFASRQPVGCPEEPEAETFEEAVQQLQADKRKQDESIPRAAVTAEDSKDVRCQKILSTLDTYVHTLDALFSIFRKKLMKQT